MFGISWAFQFFTKGLAIGSEWDDLMCLKYTRHEEKISIKFEKQTEIEIMRRIEKDQMKKKYQRKRANRNAFKL